jgi:hypothetical protein
MKMTKARYIKRMEQHEKSFAVLWSKICKDTNSFIIDNPSETMRSIPPAIDELITDLCLSGAWIKDRMEGFSGVPHYANYKKSMTRKIRKILGYTF